MSAAAQVDSPFATSKGNRDNWFDEIGPAYWETPSLIDPTPYEEFSEDDAARASLAIDGILAAHRKAARGFHE